jgi:hypothetical protein
MPKSGLPYTTAPGLLALVLLAAAPAASAGALDAYYERALMGAADARCGLFSPDIRQALAAARAQARGAVLRAGVGQSALEATTAQAQARAARVPCGSADLKVAAERVRQAFRGYADLLRMDFPGDAAGWAADRSLPSHTPVWRLVQTAKDEGGIRFGVAGRWGDPQALIVSVASSGQAPYAARLLVRDPARAPGPYLNQVAAGPSGRLSLGARAAPRWASLAFEAEDRAPTGPSLKPPGAASATGFRFPAAAISAIAALDPREAVTIELVYEGQGRDVSRRAFIEVGDFAAGMAFLAAGKR